MIKLYGGARSRASIVKWYLEELQAPHEFQLLDMQVGQHLQPEFLAINRQFKDEMQRVLMKQRILRKEYDSQVIFWVCD